MNLSKRQMIADYIETHGSPPDPIEHLDHATEPVPQVERAIERHERAMRERESACIDDPDAPCHIDEGSHGPREIHNHRTEREGAR